MDRLKIALVGAGNRGSGTYLPIIAKLEDDLELVAVCDVDKAKAERHAARYGVPAFDRVEEMVEKTKPDIAAVVVNPNRNHEVGIPLSQMGVSYCTETPIDTDLGWADKMIETANATGTKIEVCENYYRVPSERIKRQMILEGVFGKVLVAYNDFDGHGYHGVGLIRSYIGFDVKPLRAIAIRRNFPVQKHTYRGGVHEKEDFQHGIIEFENESVGVFNWTGLGYGSPLRWYNTTKFLAERGICVGGGQRTLNGMEQIGILNEAGDSKLAVVIERRMTKSRDGADVLDAMIARTDPDTGLEVVWENPLRKYSLSEGQISVASELMSIANAHRNNTDPEYGPYNGRMDQEIAVAMAQSWSSGGAAVEMPLPVTPR